MSNNPALKDIAYLISEWSIELSNAAFLPSKPKISFSLSYGWKADGAEIAVQQGNDEAKPPQKATWIIGRNESEDKYTVLYADNRGVSRIYQMSFRDSIGKMWRDNPKFSQRFNGTFREDKQAIDVK